MPKKSALDRVKEAGFVIRIRGNSEFVTVPGLLMIGHEIGIKSLNTEIISIDHDLKQAIFRCEITTDQDRVFVAHGDADQTNTGRNIAIHYIRMAETRAIARCLRMVCGKELHLTAFEELDEVTQKTQQQPRKQKKAPPKKVETWSDAAKEPSQIEIFKSWSDKCYDGFDVMDQFCIEISASKTSPKEWDDDKLASFMSQMDSNNGITARYKDWYKERIEVPF